MTLWSLALGAAVAAEPPSPLPMTASEEAALAAREIVVRQLDDGWVIGVLDVRATPTETLEAVLDLPARVADVDAIQEISLYVEEPGLIGARWSIGGLGLSSTFHILYEIDWATSYGAYSLDTSRDNDIAASEGSYHAYAHGSGSRLVYRAWSESSAPEFVRQRLLASSLEEQLGGIRRRAEQ